MTAVSERSPEPAGFNLDSILAELGSFGKYQLLLLLLLAFRDSYLAMCNFNYVFAAADVRHRCVIPECESNTSAYNASWGEQAIAGNGEISRCSRPQPSGLVGNDSRGTLLPGCSARFVSESRVKCEKRVYESYDSIVAEFDLGCDQWKRTLVGTVHNLGLVFSFVVNGLISDKYGRKVVIVGTPLVVAVAGLLKSFSVNYWMLIVLEFLETALGYGNASIVLSLEAVTHQRRVVFSCISDILANLGSAMFGLIAWRLPYWRYMMRAIYAPLLVVVFYIFLVDEGVRWLLAHDKHNEAVRILNKVAKMNNVTLSKTAKEMMNSMAEHRTKSIKSAHALEKSNRDGCWMLSVLKSRAMRFRLAVISFCFFCTLFVYNGALINSSGVSGDKYLNFSLLLLAAVPTRIISAITLNRYGRKRPICVAYCLCSIFFVLSAFIPHSVWWVPTLLYLLGKMCVSFGLFAVTVFALEVFPTTSRNSLTNLANTVGRIGSVLAPQTPLLADYMTGLPNIVLGVGALGPAVVALLLPEPGDAALPDDIDEAEQLDHQPESDNDQRAEHALDNKGYECDVKIVL